jgi:hypothetical protein
VTFARKLVVGAGLALVLAQLIPVARTNPPVESEVPAPANVRAILERSCYDCHSNKTVWPKYAYVAPASWLVAFDVHRGRNHMNFSTWNRYSRQEQAKHLEEVWEQVSSGEMPLGTYLPFHPEARLSDSDKAALKAWSESR